MSKEKFDPRSHIGEIHGIYKIIDMLDKKDKYGHWIYKSQCIKCGNIKLSHYGIISGERNKAKICNHVIKCGKYTIKPGCFSNKRIAHIFYNMMKRCYNQSTKDYRWYGAKGIIICDEWLKDPREFENWSLLNGYNSKLTIDRIDSSKNYCPENCQWIAKNENSRKAGKVNWITIDGRTLSGHQWALELSIGYNAFNRFIKKYGVEKTTELIRAMLKDPPCNKNRGHNQTWFSVYGIEI